MRRRNLMSGAILVGLLPLLQKSAVSLAVYSPASDSPAAVVSIAEDAFGRGDFKAFADCFDTVGQKEMIASYIGQFASMLSEAPAGPDAKNAKVLFAKYGVTDLAKHGGESDDQFAERISSHIKDLHGFMIEATPLAFPNPNHTGPIKGKLDNVKLDGPKGKATYVVKLAQSDSAVSQDLTFARTAASWKIASVMFFVSPEG